MQRMEMNDREFKEWADNVARKKASVLSLLDGLTDYVSKRSIITFKVIMAFA